jgi:REP element-mobilizing transposase RayT
LSGCGTCLARTLKNAIRVVFSTKDRARLLPQDFQLRLWSYAAGICKKEGIFVHAIGGMDDHIHLVIQIPPPLALLKKHGADYDPKFVFG